MLGKAFSALIAAVLKFFTDNRSVVASVAAGYVAAKQQDKAAAQERDNRQTDAAIARREANAGLSQPAAAHQLLDTYNRRKQRRTIN